MLAQLNISSPTFPKLPAPPVLEHLVFENPWPVIAGIVLVMLAAGYALRGRRRHMLAAEAGLLALALALFLGSRLVTTQRELLTQRTRALVAALAKADPAVVRAYTADGGYAWAYREWPRDEFIGVIDEAARNKGRYTVAGASFTVSDYSIHDVRARIESPTIAKTQINVTGWPDSGPPTATWWELDWDREADGEWRVRSVRLLWDTIGGNHKR